MSEIQKGLRDHCYCLDAGGNCTPCRAADALDAQAQEIARLTRGLDNAVVANAQSVITASNLAAECDALRARLADRDSDIATLNGLLSGEIKENGTLRARLAQEEEAHAALQARCYDGGGSTSVFDEVVALRARLADIHAALSGRKMHDYRCASEHGRYAKRCDCGMQQAIDAARGGA